MVLTLDGTTQHDQKDGGSGVAAEDGEEDEDDEATADEDDEQDPDEDDELLLVHLYKVLMGGVKVEAVEQLAHEMDRSAFEVICRLQFLTQASTKITEGLGVDVGDD